MAGKIRRNKTKKSGSQNTPPQFVVMNPDDKRNDDDDDLINDLMIQLDSRDENVQRESAAVLNQVNLNKQPDQTETHHKQSAKSRFQARQVIILPHRPDLCSVWIA
jgi:OTU domain-containing protein 6